MTGTAEKLKSIIDLLEDGHEDIVNILAAAGAVSTTILKGVKEGREHLAIKQALEEVLDVLGSELKPLADALNNVMTESCMTRARAVKRIMTEVELSEETATNIVTRVYTDYGNAMQRVKESSSQ